MSDNSNAIKLLSADVQVFPAGFRSETAINSAQITEQNLTQFKILSADSKNESFFIINHSDDKSKILGATLGLDGYIFNLDATIAEIIIDDQAKQSSAINYVTIALRFIDTVGWVLTDINAMVAGDTSSNNLDSDVNGIEVFNGLYFSTNPVYPQYDPKMFKVKSYKIADLQRNLRLNASEIRNKSDELNAIDKIFTTETLDATTANISSINLIDNINQMRINLPEDVFMQLESDATSDITVTLDKNISIKEDIDITTEKLQVGADSAISIMSETGKFKAHNLQILTPDSSTTLKLGQDIEIPATQNTKQVLGSNNKWVPYSTDTATNTLVARDTVGNTAVNNLKAASVNNIKITKTEADILEISTDTDINIDKSKLEIGKGFNLEVCKSKGAQDAGHLAVIKATADGSSDTYISINDRFNTAKGANVQIGSPLVVDQNANGVRIGDASIEFNTSNAADAKTLTLTGTLTLPSDNNIDKIAIPVQTTNGDWEWYPVSANGGSFKHIPITNDDGQLLVEISSKSCIGMNVARANKFKVNSNFGVNDSTDIYDDGNKPNIRPLLFVDQTDIYSSLTDEFNNPNPDGPAMLAVPDNHARYADAAIAADIYLDKDDNVHFDNKDITCKSINNVEVKGAGRVTVDGKIGIQATDSAILTLSGNLNLPANSIWTNTDSDYDLKILSQGKTSKSIWTPGSSSARANSIAYRDDNGNSSFNNIVLNSLKNNNYAIYITNDGSLVSESFATIDADKAKGTASLRVVSDIQQDSKGKIKFTKADIQTATNDKSGVVKGVAPVDPIEDRDYTAAIENGKIIVNVPWKDVTLVESEDQGRIILEQRLPGRAAVSVPIKLAQLATDGRPRFDIVTANTFLGVSDIRLKENIRDYRCSKSILELPIKQFDYIDGSKNVIGCIAQDLQEICPELVVADENGYLSINESKLIYLLIQEVKDLKDKINSLN